MSEAHTTAVPHDAEGDVEVTAHHLPSDVYYIRIAVALAVITAIEVAITYTSLATAPEIAILLVLMAIKFTMVASNFMHLKFDDRLLTWIFYSGLFLAVGVYIVALTSLHVFAG